MKKVMDHDPVTGISHVFYYDDETDEARIVAEQEVDEIIDENKSLYNDAPTQWGDYARVAQLPLTVYHDLKRKGIIDNPAEMRKWLNDPDNRFFRTRPGTI
jgi:hypothetical protein